MNENTKLMKKPPMKRPITLVVAAFFLIAAIVPIYLLFAPAPVLDNVDNPPIAAENIEDKNLTASEKIDIVAEKMEIAFYSDQTEAMQGFYSTGTTILVYGMIGSSLLMSAALFTMYFAPKHLDFNVRSIMLIFCLVGSLIGVLVLAIMHIYSTIAIVNDLIDLNNAVEMEQKTRDSRITENFVYLLRNVLIAAGFILYLYKVTSFALTSEISKNKPKKLAKASKGLTSAYTAVGLICCLFALTIFLTWKLNFIAIALLATIGAAGIKSFLMVGYSYQLRSYYKELTEKNPVCTSCGNKLEHGQTFCGKCGTKSR